MLDDPAERRRALERVAGFMAWKRPRSFVLSAARDPIAFGAQQWFGLIGQDHPDAIALLPAGETARDAETLEDVQRAFGPGGEFETWRLA
jgi:hypothetical protein